MHLPVYVQRKPRPLAGRLMAGFILCLVCLLLLVGCTNGSGSSQGPTPTAQQILTAVQKNYRAVTAYHLVMKTDNLGTSGASQLLISAADGDVGMPDKVRAQASILFSGQSVTVNLISVGTQQYITDPITGQWRIVSGIFDPRLLINPDTGIIALAGKLQNVTGPTADTVNGTACWRVSGLLDAKDLAFFTGGGVPAGTKLQTSICAGQSDELPYQVVVTGEAAVGDTAQTRRTFDISKYNENISIAVPQV